MSKRAKSAAKGDGVIDVDVVQDSAAPHARAPKVGVLTVAKPCLIGIAVLTVVGTALPH